MSEPWHARYRVIERLGSGAMGIVYRAEHLALSRPCAIKVLAAGGAADRTTRSRFHREAQAMCRVVHPGLVKIYEVSGPDEEPYIAMELVPGRTLQAEMNAQPARTRGRAESLLAAIADAVAALHRAGVSHRDLKPENIMVRPDGSPVVMDLGLAKDAFGAWTAVTGQNMMVGTPAFLAPEIFHGEESRARQDVWALGALYYWLYTGTRPFPGDTIDELYRDILDRPMRELAEHCAGMAPRQKAFLLRMLERDPAKRLPDAGEVARALDGARRGGPARRAPRARSARGAAVAVALTLAAAGALAVALAFRTPHAPGPTIRVRAGTSPAVASPGEARAIEHVRAWPLVGRWRALAPELRVLKGGGAAARKRARELETTAPVPLSGQPGAWLFWWELGTWLEAPERRWPHASMPPASPDTALVELSVSLYAVSWRGTRFSAQIAGAAINAVDVEPGDASGWLMLGLCLEEEGDAARALAPYRVGLRLLDGRTLPSGASLLAWQALARALVVVRPAALERDWARLSTHAQDHWRRWRGLARACQRDARERMLTMLREMPKDSDDLPAARNALAYDMELHDADPAAVWRMIDEPPGTPVTTLLDARYQNRLARGRVTYPRTGRVPCAWQGQLAAYQPAPPDERWLDDGCGKLPETAFLSLALESGDLATARKKGEEWTRNGVLGRAAWESARARLALRAPVLDEVAPLIASGRLPWDELDALAGNLTAPVDAPWFERALEDRAAAGDAGTCARVALALWLSRAGRHAEALDALEPVRAHPHVRAAHEDAVLEVLARPLWEQLVGRALPPPVLERLPAAADPPSQAGEVPALWRALRQRDASGAAAAAERLVERNPRHAVRVLALAYAGAARAAVDPQDDRLARARASARFVGMDLWVLEEIRRLGRASPGPAGR